jgi:hypothetical protein
MNPRTHLIHSPSNKEETMNQQVAVLTKHFTQWMQESVFEFDEDFRFRQAKRLLLANGVSLSIQASQYAYCYPREILPYAQYSTVSLKWATPLK